MHREFIYYNEDFTGKENFSGEFSPANVTQRKEYLTEYAKFLKEEYGLTDLPKKAVEDSELGELAKKYAFTNRKNKNILYFNEMRASIKPFRSPYRNWTFYSFGVKEKDGVLEFSDGITPPVPAAKYEFGGDGRLSAVEFSFYTDKFEKLSARAAVNNVRGRTFEIRSGIYTVIKLHLLTDGNLYYLDGSKRGTHPTFVFLSKCEAGQWTKIKIRLRENDCDVLVGNEEKLRSQNLYTDKIPDNFFVSGGMIPFGDWKLRMDALQLEKKAISEFFIPTTSETVEETDCGMVKLPYAIGTFVNKDNALIFRKNFDISLKKRAKLVIKSIDPCGFVYLNGVLIYQAENFLKKEISVEKYLKEKNNLLEIVVLPRAPEVFYQWHKHSDPYNGWFFSGAYVESYDDAYVEDLFVTTNCILEQSVKATVYAKFYGQGVADIYLRKIYPTVENEIKIDSTPFSGETLFAKQYELAVALWDTENPNLYELVIKVNDNYEKSIETGFRIIEQKNGEIHLNGKRIFLNGALSMQFLPPHEETPVNHLCPSDEQIVMQFEQIKRMSGNTLRMHFLGYGSNDERYARFADRMGVMLIWTTRLIDSIESVFLNDEWAMKDAYIEQVKDVRQYPSIIMWEGSNEACGRFPQIDKMYDEFVSAVKSVDKTRLLCPCSHLYYGGGLYDDSADNCEYYQENGLADQNMQSVKSSWGWLDKDVVRSAHTYAITLGYGCEWDWMVNQDWATQSAMLESKQHAYIVSEYSIIGRACTETKEAKEYFNPDSYELINEYTSLGVQLSNEEYELSQAHQALCALYANKRMRTLDVDGMLWCCLQGGANDGAYLKPILDFYGYAKLGYYVLKDTYRQNYCVLDCDGPFWNKTSRIKPVLLAEQGKYVVQVTVKDKKTTLFKKRYKIENTKWITPLGICDFKFEKKGYYRIYTQTEKIL